MEKRNERGAGRKPVFAETLMSRWIYRAGIKEGRGNIALSSGEI